jgi:hypothetical protein
MGNQKKNQRESTEADVPHGGIPGDGAGRIEDPGSQHAGVWPVSSMPSGDPEARIHDMGSFGQGDRGLAGYEDSGESEIFTMPPDDSSGATQSGSNAG